MRERPRRTGFLRRVPILLGAVALGAAAASAQDLEPRAYSPSPKGTSFALVVYSYATGDVVFDPSLPFRNVKAHLNGVALGYGHTFGLFGHSASLAIGVPYAWGTISGDVGEQFRSIYRSGLADLKVRFTSSLVGGPALDPKEFAQRHPRPTLGMSLVVTAPTGQYDPAKLINISANRWAVKPELGFSYPAGRWTLEAYAGVWFYTDNDDYYGGQRRSQSPLGTFQAHVGYTFKPRLWLAGDATFYGGGSTTVNGVAKNDRLENSRGGLTLSLPLGRHYSFKVSWASGVTTRIGGDFDTYGVAIQRVWF